MSLWWGAGDACQSEINTSETKKKIKKAPKYTVFLRNVCHVVTPCDFRDHLWISHLSNTVKTFLLLLLHNRAAALATYKSNKVLWHL